MTCINCTICITLKIFILNSNEVSQGDTYAFTLSRKNKKNVFKQAVLPQNYKVMKLSFYNHSKK